MRIDRITFAALALVLAGGIACRDVPLEPASYPEIDSSSRLQAPVPYRPKDGRSFPYPTQLILGWGALTSARGYRVEVSDSPSFDVLEFSASVTGRYVVTPTFPTKTYYWRVVAFDTSGDKSEWSVVKRFAIVPGEPTE